MDVTISPGLLISRYWYWCDSIGNTFLVLPRVSLILLMRSTANSIAYTFMSKKIDNLYEYFITRFFKIIIMICQLMFTINGR